MDSDWLSTRRPTVHLFIYIFYISDGDISGWLMADINPIYVISHAEIKFLFILHNIYEIRVRVDQKSK